MAFRVSVESISPMLPPPLVQRAGRAARRWPSASTHPAQPLCLNLAGEFVCFAMIACRSCSTSSGKPEQVVASRR